MIRVDFMLIAAVGLRLVQREQLLNVAIHISLPMVFMLMLAGLILDHVEALL